MSCRSLEAAIRWTADAGTDEIVRAAAPLRTGLENIQDSKSSMSIVIGILTHIDIGVRGPTTDILHTRSYTPLFLYPESDVFRPV